MRAYWSLPMKSLILTLLYLAKDTVHRWFTRISSPLARVLVVFFLTLCALASLGGYVISTKLVRDKIIKRGGNIVVAVLSPHDKNSYFVPNQKEVEEIVDADSYALHHVGSARMPSGQQTSVFTCEFSRLGQMLPLMAPGGGPTFLQSEADAREKPGPADAVINNVPVCVYVRNLPESHPIIHMMHGSGLIVQQEDLDRFMVRTGVPVCTFALVIRRLETAEPIIRAENFLRGLMHMENMHSSLISALPLIKEMDLVLGKQTQCRLAFCVGISCIVGILLTALAGMEYRQNEYIYTLMKSFGIHPLLLVGAFITENIVIVGTSFIGAIAVFMYFQRMIVTQILKLGNYTLGLEEIMPEIALISYTLLGCVLVSAIPILVAANRQIGRVLK